MGLEDPLMGRETAEAGMVESQDGSNCPRPVNPKLSMSLPADSTHARYGAPAELVGGVACCKFV
jgi:hypothetical protein